MLYPALTVSCRRSRSQLPAAQYLNKTVIMIHSIPSSNSTLLSTLKQFVPAVGATYVTDLSIDQTDVYASFGPDWQTFVKDVALLNGRTGATNAAAPARLC